MCVVNKDYFIRLASLLNFIELAEKTHVCQRGWHYINFILLELTFNLTYNHDQT
jgi:hypothetical protein